MSELPIETPPLPLWRRRGTQIAAGVTLVVLLVAGWCWHRSGAASESAVEPVVSVRVTQAQVAKDCRIAESTISEVLADKRKLNRKQIGKLATYFHVKPTVFNFDT